LINKSPTIKAFEPPLFYQCPPLDRVVNPLKIIQYAAAIAY